MAESKENLQTSFKLSPLEQEFKAQMWEFLPQLKKLHETTGITPELFLSQIMTLVLHEPKLLNMVRRSLVASVLMAGELGLELNRELGLAWIVPFAGTGTNKNQAKLIIGYKGAVELMYRHPDVTQIRTSLVYRNEDYDHTEGLEPNLRHRPMDVSGTVADITAERDQKLSKAKNEAEKEKVRHEYRDMVSIEAIRGERRCAYVAVKFRGEWHFKVMYREDIGAIKKFSQNQKNYSEENDPMGWFWRKACIFQIAKEMPFNKKLSRALNADAILDAGGTLQLRKDSEGNTQVEIVPNEQGLIASGSQAGEIEQNPNQQEIQFEVSPKKDDKKQAR